jgi:hypothetical protein
MILSEYIQLLHFSPCCSTELLVLLVSAELAKRGQGSRWTNNEDKKQLGMQSRPHTHTHTYTHTGAEVVRSVSLTCSLGLPQAWQIHYTGIQP